MWNTFWDLLILSFAPIPLSTRLNKSCIKWNPYDKTSSRGLDVKSYHKAPSHLTECRRTKGDEWEKCTKCTRIQRIQTEFPSNHAISNYCQILSTNDKRRINIKCEGYRLFGSPL